VTIQASSLRPPPDATDSAPVTVRLAVAGAESVASGGGRSELAWIVTAILADVETSYRIGVESRELLRQTQRLADGTRVDFAR